MIRPLQVWALLFAAAAALEFGLLHLAQGPEHALADAMTRVQARTLVPDRDIVLIDIDDASLARLRDEAGSWPWPRAVYAELIAGLQKQQPRAIVFDILFTEADRFRPDSDALFIDAIRGNRNIYFPMLRMAPQDDAKGLKLASVAAVLGIHAGPQADPQARAMLLPPLALPESQWRTGVVNFLQDDDGVGRRYHLRLDLQGWELPSLPMRLARDLGYTIPDGAALRLHWRGGTSAFRSVSFAELYEDFQRREPRRLSDEFRDSIVLIGTTASGLHDLRVTPIDSRYPGLQILATAIDNLKNGRWLRETSPLWPVLLSLLLLVAIWLAFRLRVHMLLTGLALLVLSIVALAAEYLALQRLLLLPLLTPLLFAWAFYAVAGTLDYLRERRARAQAVRLFGRFLNPEVVNQLVERGETVASLSGRTREISVLFSDIRGFTALSETRPPQEIVALLNRYFTLQVAVVFRHGGTLDKFIGDCIMAFWGAPLDDPNHADRAVACALEMQAVLIDFKRELGAAGESFDVGIGIHSGSAVVGFIGSEQKLEYTAIGDTVNLASRVEGVTKNVARILVSADTVQACRQQRRFSSRGTFHVKGRTQEVELFEPEES